MRLKPRLKHLAYLPLLPIAAAALYFGTAFLMLLFPANTQADPDKSTIDAFVISNGVHVDLVFPVSSGQIDWTTIFPLQDLPAPPANPRYLAIGWGDREFYLNTQEIADITATRALGALFGGHRALVHVNYLADLDFQTSRYALPLTAQQYAALIRYVRQTAVLRENGAAVVIAGRHYGALDAFYEAHGSYSMFNTCNTWIGAGLRQARVKVSRWTPLDSMVTWHLQPVRGAPSRANP